MIRRQRPVREIPFSFDCFVDVVANVIGIIIRLILVVWVGARSYHHAKALPVQEHAAPAAVQQAKPVPVAPVKRVAPAPLRVELPAPDRDDKLRERAQLQAANAALATQVAALDKAAEQLLLELGYLRQQQAQASQQLQEVDRVVRGEATQQLSLTEQVRTTQERCQQLAKTLAELEKLPRASKVLRYHAPVSQAVSTDEVFFECKNGRATFIDIAAMVHEIRARHAGKRDLLRDRWEMSDVTQPVGAFRLRYTLERERTGLEDALQRTTPDPNAAFRIGLTWAVEPIALERGETLGEALQAGSVFRQIIDSANPHTTVITLWVYPDSFPLYRGLRDYLSQQNFEVAGRPLPDHIAIRSSRSGSASRGQ